MKEFVWERAQQSELDWWEKWERKDEAVLGSGGTSRYPCYMDVFADEFSRESILDVGGGAYPLVNWIACRRRVSIDPLNSQFYEKGFRRNPDVTYLDGMAEELPFPDDAFEQVFLLNMLDHLDGWRQAVDEAVRVASNSVLIHVHIDGPFAGDGMHRVMREEEIVDCLERKHGGVRVPFAYPPQQKSVLRRYGSRIKHRLLGRGKKAPIAEEKCWAGLIRKDRA